MIVTFHDVIISIEAKDANAAYDRLCEVLGTAAQQAGDLEYTTDTYSTDENLPGRHQPSTEELWPDNRKAKS